MKDKLLYVMEAAGGLTIKLIMAMGAVFFFSWGVAIVTAGPVWLFITNDYLGFVATINEIAELVVQVSALVVLGLAMVALADWLIGEAAEYDWHPTFKYPEQTIKRDWESYERNEDDEGT